MQQLPAAHAPCRLLAWAFFRTKLLTGRLPRWLRWPLMPLLRWFSGKATQEGLIAWSVTRAVCHGSTSLETTTCVCGGTEQVSNHPYAKLSRSLHASPHCLPPSCAGLLGGVLSSTMLVASEVAVEYWLALSWSPQAQWLRESQQAGPLQASTPSRVVYGISRCRRCCGLACCTGLLPPTKVAPNFIFWPADAAFWPPACSGLQEEIAAESRRVCKFIIDREIEASGCAGLARWQRLAGAGALQCCQPSRSGLCFEAASQAGTRVCWCRPPSVSSPSRAIGWPSLLPALLPAWLPALLMHRPAPSRLPSASCGLRSAGC